MRKTSHPKSVRQVRKPNMTGADAVCLFFSKSMPLKGWRRRFISFLLTAIILFTTAAAIADPHDPNRNDNEAISVIKSTREIVFIDPRLPDRGELISDLADQAEEGRHFELIVLDINRDGIDQISQVLMGRFQVDAIHFFSHGANGAIQLGGSWFNTESFEANTRKIAGWKQSLKIGADLVFYGCDFASNTEGRALVQRLAALTKADVAASSDKTGHASQGGDWDLEFSIGSIETHAALTSIARDNWKQVLAIAVDRSTWIRIPSTSPNPFTFSHETAGGGRLLLVSVASQPNQDDGIVETVTGITYGGQPLQKKGEGNGHHHGCRCRIGNKHG